MIRNKIQRTNVAAVSTCREANHQVCERFGAVGLRGRIMIVPTHSCCVHFVAMVSILVLGCNSADSPEPLSGTTQADHLSAISPLEIEGATASTSSGVKRDVNKDLIAATSLVNAGDIASAKALLQPLLIEQPENATALFLLARGEASLQNFEEALALLELIPPTHPEAGLPALGMSADWLIQLGQLDEAEEKLRSVLKLQDRFIVAHRRLAQLLNCQGRHAEAMPHLRALAKFQVATPSELYGMNAASDPFVQKDVSKLVDIPLSDLCIAKLQWFSGKQQEAKLMASNLLSEVPVSTAAAAFAGRVFSTLQDDGLFADWSKNVPNGIDREPEYWFAIGHWHQQHGKHEVAVRCFAEAVTRDDTDRFSFLAMARSLEVVGRDDLARLAFRRSQLLEEVNYIVTGLERTTEQLHRLGQILNQLQRPHEALAWMKLSTEPIAESVLSSGESVEVERDTKWLTCGVNTEDWPLPELSQIIPRDASPLERPDVVNGTISLEDVAAASGLKFQFDPGRGSPIDELHMYQVTGAGMGVLDFDRDGWPDLYCGQGGGNEFSGAESASNELFRNMGGSHFQNCTQQSSGVDYGYAQGVATGDIDQDGFVDLIVANIGPNVILRNNGDGTFTRQLLGELEQNAWTASIACGDLDGDSLPEIVVVNYINDPAIKDASCSGPDASNCSPQKFHAAANEVLRQTEEGIWVPWRFTKDDIRPTYGLGVIMTDIDGRNGNDLYIANDTEPNSLFLSEPESIKGHQYRLRELAQLRGCAVGLRGNSEGSMGVASGDFDRNGMLDMHVSNFANEPSAVYLQHDHGIFVNKNIGLGLEEETFASVGWGTQAADFDNNGWTDIAILNGHIYPSLPDGSPYQMLPQLFRGGAAGFERVDSVSSSYWSTPRLGRSLVKLDWNRDGLVDLASVHIGAPIALLQNSSSVGNWVQVELVATERERSAVGARVKVVCANQEWVQWVTSGDGYQSSNESSLSFGLGSESTIERIEVRWLSGVVANYNASDINRRYLLVENESIADARAVTDK